jgi:hypothetical protein
MYVYTCAVLRYAPITNRHGSWALAVCLNRLQQCPLCGTTLTLSRSGEQLLQSLNVVWRQLSRPLLLTSSAYLRFTFPAVVAIVCIECVLPQ